MMHDDVAISIIIVSGEEVFAVVLLSAMRSTQITQVKWFDRNERRSGELELD